MGSRLCNLALVALVAILTAACATGDEQALETRTVTSSPDWQALAAYRTWTETMPTTTTSTTTTSSTPAPVVSSGRCAIPDYICARESGYRPDVVSPNGVWHGKYQFTQGTWDHAVAGAGHPEYVGVPAELAPEAIQDAAAAWLWAQPGGCRHWGAC